MIFTKLLGGLGNQMFQYALGRHMAVLNNTELGLDTSTLLERSSHITYTHRDFELSIFNINDAKISNKGISPDWISKIANKINPYQVVKERDLKFDSKVLSARGKIYLEGFWQSENYFIGIEDTIRKDFTFKNQPNDLNKEIIADIQSSNSVSLHFRLGDYLTNASANAHHGVLSIEYYKQAIAYFNEVMPDVKYFIFSDDINWVKNNITIDKPHRYIDHNKADQSYEDMRLMSLCKHNVIANSSFSWWGAWLNSNDQKKVVAPKKWLNNQDTDIVPSQWIRM